MILGCPIGERINWENVRNVSVQKIALPGINSNTPDVDLYGYNVSHGADDFRQLKEVLNSYKCYPSIITVFEPRRISSHDELYVIQCDSEGTISIYDNNVVSIDGRYYLMLPKENNYLFSELSDIFQ